jgi:cyanuric acid amidohydrolase
VSIAADHQGPHGGGPVIAIADLGENPTGYPQP